MSDWRKSIFFVENRKYLVTVHSRDAHSMYGIGATTSPLPQAA